MLNSAVSRIRNSTLRSPLQRSLSCIASIAAPMLVTAGSVEAADMPVKAPRPAAPVYNWTGCYAGLNGGGGASGTNFHARVDPGSYLGAADAAEVSNDGTGSHNNSNFLGGGQARLQLADRLSPALRAISTTSTTIPAFSTTSIRFQS
jgi:hypothetical protein